VVGVLRGSGGSVSLATFYAPIDATDDRAWGSAVASGDFNNDGKLDLVLGASASVADGVAAGAPVRLPGVATFPDEAHAVRTNQQDARESAVTDHGRAMLGTCRSARRATYRIIAKCRDNGCHQWRIRIDREHHDALKARMSSPRRQAEFAAAVRLTGRDPHLHALLVPDDAGLPHSWRKARAVSSNDAHAGQLELREVERITAGG
jgi:hypothetical protein